VPYSTAVSRDIDAPAHDVFALVSDLTRMGEWSPENTGGNWVKGSTGPGLGAVFRGNNRNGLRRWSTTVTVIAFDPGASFEIAVTSGPLEVAHWRYDFEETESGCRVTESFEDRRKPWFAFIARTMGDHSSEHAEHEMTQTLANLAEAAQATTR
jgi:Polyketide cyclase / dehydrase and lipid transport